MKNTIKITIPFSFKGVEHSPSSVIDLDIFILGEQSLNNAYQLVANENKIDNFSYEYEVLESSKKIFSDPTGFAVGFLSDDSFDLTGYKKQVSEYVTIDKVQGIALEFLNIDNLENHQDVKQALLEAYKLGKEDL